MYAIIRIGSKQYKIREKSKIIIDKINKKIGKQIKFKYKEIILIYKNNKIYFLKKDLINFKITAKIISHIKNKKIKILKFKRRKHHKKKIGHRQKYTKIEIKKIGKKNGT